MVVSVTLPSRLASDFEPGTRGRGLAYYREGAVHILRASDSQVTAAVYGARKYTVTLEFEAGELDMSCDCPYFDSTGPCKHLWAAILAAEARGALAAVNSAPKVVPVYDFDLDEYEPDEEDSDDDLGLLGPPPRGPVRGPREPDWRQQIAAMSAKTPAGTAFGEAWPAHRQVLYIVDVPSSVAAAGLILELCTRDRKKDGKWAKSKPLRLMRRTISELPEAADRAILSQLLGGSQYYGYGPAYEALASTYQLQHPLAGVLMPMMARTSRCYLRLTPYDGELKSAVWDDSEAWQFRLEMGREQGQWRVTGFLHRGEERMDLAEPSLITAGGLVFAREQVAPLDGNASFPWIFHLRKSPRLIVPGKDTDEFLASILASKDAPPVDVPEELRYEEVRLAPRPCLRVRALRPGEWVARRLEARLFFDYEDRRVAGPANSRGFFETEARRFVVRDVDVETAAAERLRELGLKPISAAPGEQPAWQVAPSKLPGLVHALLDVGWHVEAEGKTFRRPGQMRVEVSSGVDWFELRGEVNYGETTAKLPELLAALRRGEKMVQLGDGTYGLLPEEWLSRFGPIAGMGASEAGHVRFRKSQAGLLDALLAAEPEISCDAAFERVREQLRSFQGVAAADQPAGFVGHLRDYQREGLGWMHFLRRFGFGGCLADDMGVGKTAQVLALLETRRELRAAGGEGRPGGPSLVVVPRSLVFNWKQEAARFTPRLRILDYTGTAREAQQFADYDVVLTTYGTLRRDVPRFQETNFDYLVLDEAQSIKNADTESAKAARLLRGEHRLALSGTPVENHLGELWSLFEFLNPGMLGSAGVFKQASGAARNPSAEVRQLLAQALRPFILRRTKEQVARELPPKTEQTIYCELEPLQRRLYDELRLHYREALLKRIQEQGLSKSKIQVLEALLRLRQAACHPALVDPRRATESSAKLDVLLDHLGEVTEEGHKALVFSQFTSLLRIVRQRLDDQGIAYEYLDGATVDRQSPVERFQSDPECRLFLISLKAGGLGLNLTAAEYVFLLDPWWNPAVEAQAMDRAHRIGQTRHVFAYRLIARETVEEKVLELQNTKRDLAEAILSADNSTIRDLRREDLELLLS